MKTDYVPAIQSAIEYIETHLNDESLNAQKIASQAGFSLYHFHRVFSATLGESVSDYVRKRRLSLAVLQLVNTRTPIAEIAINAGFEGQESFTRAFKKLFDVTPAACRKRGFGVVARQKSETTPDMVRHLIEGVSMEPRIITRDAELAVGMGSTFKPCDTGAIGALWQQFVSRMNEIENAKPDYALGICQMEHPSIPKTDNDSIIYIAALPVNSIDTIPQGMVLSELPEAKYAVFTHKGPIKDIAHTVRYIWGTWASESGYKLKSTPDFELYDERFNAETGDGEVDIYVAVE